jgi:hypothetical protein
MLNCILFLRGFQGVGVSVGVSVGVIVAVNVFGGAVVDVDVAVVGLGVFVGCATTIETPKSDPKVWPASSLNCQ